MCLAVPGRVVALSERDGTLMAEVDFGGVRKDVCLRVHPRRRGRRVRHRARRASRSSGSTRSRRSQTLANFETHGHPRGGVRRRVRAGRPAGRPGRPGREPTRARKGPAMKYLDEFSDPDLAGRLLDQIHAVTTGTVGDHGGLRRADPLDHPARHRPAAARRHRDDPRPGLPGLRHAAGDHRQGAGDRRSSPDVIFCSFGDMLRVPGSSKDLFRIKSAGGDVRVVYSPLDALNLARENPDREVVFFGIGFETTAPANAMTVYQAQAARHPQLLAAGLARAGAAGDRGDHGVADLPGAGVPGRRPRVQRDGHRPSTRRWPRSTRCRSWSPGSSRSTSSRASAAPCCSSSRAGTSWRTPTRGRCRAEGNPAAMAMLRGRLRGDRPGLARHRDDPGQRLAAVRARTATSTPRSASTSRGIHTEESSICRSGEVLQGLIKPHECAAFGKRVHAAQPARRHDGVVRGRLRGVLPRTGGWSCRRDGPRRRWLTRLPGCRSTSRAGSARRRCGTRRRS